MNRGAQHLAEKVREWIAADPEKRTQNGAAELVGCDTGNFSKILQGKRYPGRKLAARIKRRFRTNPEWFDDPPAEVSQGAA